MAVEGNSPDLMARLDKGLLINKHLFISRSNKSDKNISAERLTYVC